MANRSGKKGAKKPTRSRPSRAKTLKSAHDQVVSGSGPTTSLYEVPIVIRAETFSVPSEEAFLSECHLSGKDLTACGVSWSELAKIAEAHVANVDNLRQTGAYIADRLRALEAVHSVKVRIKQPSHLLAKIIRKCREDSKRLITAANYQSEITDIIGIRALHLFKDEWQPIHRFVRANWGLVEEPTANVRVGDSEKWLDAFRREGCSVKEHPFGYRSVHYVLKSQPTKDIVIAELQVRTIFEEGWSEIDHRVRYPSETVGPALAELLVLFNRLAGSADEMGSFVSLLKRVNVERESEVARDRSRYESTVQELKDQIAALKIDSAEKEKLVGQVRELEKRRPATGQRGITVSGNALTSEPFGPATIAPTFPAVSFLNTASDYFQLPNAYSGSFLGPTPTSFIVPQTCNDCGRQIDHYSSLVNGRCQTCLLKPLNVISTFNPK